MPIASSPPDHRVVRFDGFTLDLASGELHRNGLEIKVPEKPLRLLTALVQHPGEIVSREELQKSLWPSGTFVEFNDNLNHAVVKLREVLGDSADNARFVETIPRRGYRFIPTVEYVSPESPLRPSWRQPAALLRYLLLTQKAWVLACVVLVVGAALLVSWKAIRPRHHPPKRIMLAVLPLENLSGDQEQEYLVDSLTEEIITKLGRLDPNHLGLIARTSVAQFKGSKKPVSTIGKELGVDYVLEGGARMANHRLRVNLQLIRVSDQTHVWAESYERNLEDAFTVEREMAEQTAHVLSLELLPSAQQRLANRPLVSADALDDYLRGRYYSSRLTRPAALLAVKYFEETIRLSPDFAPAHAALADVYFRLGQPLGPNTAKQARQYLSESQEEARKALALDDSLAEAHAYLGQSILFRDWDWTTSQSEMQRALELDPNSVVVLRPYSVQLIMTGQYESSRQSMRKALELDPTNPVTRVLAAELLLYAHEYDEAEAEARHVLTTDPAYGRAHMILAWLQELRGEGDEAATEYNKAGLLTSEQAASLAHAFRTAGMQGFRMWCIRELQEGGIQAGKGRSFGIAARYASMGDGEQALHFLEEAVQEHDGNLLFCKVNPWFDKLHSDPRFQAVLRRIGIPE